MKNLMVLIGNQNLEVEEKLRTVRKQTQKLTGQTQLLTGRLSSHGKLARKASMLNEKKNEVAEIIM